MLNGFKILAFREPFWSLPEKDFFDCVKIFVWGKYLFCGKLSCLFAENFQDCEKFPWL